MSHFQQLEPNTYIPLGKPFTRSLTGIPFAKTAEGNQLRDAVKGAMHTDDGLQGDERALTAELDAEKAAKNAKDVLLNEAVRILADEVGLIKTDTRLASRVLPYTPEPAASK